jgi:hypothetical protein
MKKSKLPSDAEYPITFAEALRLTVGGRSVPDRFRIWRGFWRSELSRVAKQTGVYTDNTDAMLAHFRHNGVDASWFGCFRAGIPAYRAELGVEQRRKAIRARWGSRKKGYRKGRKCKSV